MLLVLVCFSSHAGGIRDHTRSTVPRDTQVSESQAEVISLAVAKVGAHQLQNWVRTAGQVDESGKKLVATTCLNNVDFVQVGQRVIAFPPNAKSSVSQARVTRLARKNGCVRIEAMLAKARPESGRFYVMEIVVPRGRFLAIPKEAIIEKEGRSLVYIHNAAGRYLPRVIHSGLKGERYTQVLHGLKAGDLVVTLGSFFIHAQHTLDASRSNESNHAHHVH